MAGVVPSLIARHNIEPFGEQIDDLALAFIPPLGADDCDDLRHWSRVSRRLSELIELTAFRGRYSCTRRGLPANPAVRWGTCGSCWAGAHKCRRWRSRHRAFSERDT